MWHENHLMFETPRPPIQFCFSLHAGNSNDIWKISSKTFDQHTEHSPQKQEYHCDHVWELTLKFVIFNLQCKPFISGLQSIRLLNLDTELDRCGYTSVTTKLDWLS